MPWFDLPLEQLSTYRTQTQEPAGLDEWWAERLAEAERSARPPVLTRYRPDVYAPLEVFVAAAESGSLHDSAA